MSFSLYFPAKMNLSVAISMPILPDVGSVEPCFGKLTNHILIDHSERRQHLILEFLVRLADRAGVEHFTVLAP
jgi:hypothetical protein